jgi:DNA repair exonuclease SbcCD ATPase subunit
MSSSSSSSDSEDLDPEDFWNSEDESFSNLPDSPQKPISPMRRGATIRNVSPSKNILKQMTSIPEDFFKQRMEQSISRLRQENEKEINSVKISVRNKTRKELKSAVDEIRAQFEREVFMIRQDHNKMKEEIEKKNKEIILIAEYMIDQEAMITQNRLQLILKVEVPEKTTEILNEEKQLKKDLNLLKIQIDAMKEAIKNYSNETIQSASKVKELDQEIELIQTRHRQELKDLEVYLESRVAKAVEEREQVRVEFENYKNSGWTELEEKEKSCGKQKEVILALQSELKKAKGILHNPKLKLRVHDRLRDYLEEYEQDSNDSPTLLGMKSVVSNRRSKSNMSRVFQSSRNNHDSSRFSSIVDTSFDLPKFVGKRFLPLG